MPWQGAKAQGLIGQPAQSAWPRIPSLSDGAWSWSDCIACLVSAPLPKAMSMRTARTAVMGARQSQASARVDFLDTVAKQRAAWVGVFSIASSGCPCESHDFEFAQHLL